ncbi:hypothetical protein FA95DRAFT_1607660 [Auriscalpium vulgare]|uniref:Uncharacterized protein n=1 Tax=Auriscalpium vulgare TaxID=40419 RepID=A0ACB8RNB6_9AGAM|nr:hypothetical protein FA95DRAFT_1607660 [Auriscalpium vulgare]
MSYSRTMTSTICTTRLLHCLSIAYCLLITHGVFFGLWYMAWNIASSEHRVAALLFGMCTVNAYCVLDMLHETRWEDGDDDDPLPPVRESLYLWLCAAGIESALLCVALLLDVDVVPQPGAPMCALAKASMALVAAGGVYLAAVSVGECFRGGAWIGVREEPSAVLPVFQPEKHECPTADAKSGLVDDSPRYLEG